MVTTELETLVADKEREWMRAYEEYHIAFMSVVDNEIAADFVHDAIAPYVMDRYYRAFEDYTLACKMLNAKNASKV